MYMFKMTSRRKKYLAWSPAVIAVFVLLGMTVQAPPKVKVVGLVKRDLFAEVYGNGTVEARVVVAVSSKITGRITEVYADQGDRVRKGQLLARLENGDFYDQWRQAGANVKQAGARRELEAANLRKALANRELAERNAARYGNLARHNLVSRLEAEQYETSRKVAREEVNRSRAALVEAEMEEAAGRAGAKLARTRLDDTFIYAPADGVIISRDLEKGATVTPGLPIFTLADPATVWVKANVDESLLKGICAGKTALISLRSSPGEQFRGRVARVSRESDRVTEESEVDVAFTPALSDFRLGEQSDVYIITESRKSAPSLPSAALVGKGRKRGVWVVENGRLRFRNVVVGIEDPRSFAEIVAGLDGSECIALASTREMAKFSDGMKVKATR